MAEYHTSKALTGNNIEYQQMYSSLKESILEAESIEMCVSFVMESGVKLMIDALKESISNGCHVTLLTGRYLNITQPHALYHLKKELGDSLDIYFYQDTEQSFHPKAYFFHYDEYDEVYVGSSNLSLSALTSGIEWNYRFTNFDDEENYDRFMTEFDNIKNNSIYVDDQVLKDYSKSWKQSALEKDLDKHMHHSHISSVEPRGVQIEALYELENTRKNGATKALIYAATGIGKTYLAAFDSQNYRHVLFVAHRQEILYQACQSFRIVRGSDDFGFFMGDMKDTENSVIFANVFSLGKKEYLNSNYFPKDYFDYIVIDEFHHAVNNLYLNIINYFKPKFLLGLTATPERMDGRNIYSLCDYNVVFEISLKDAINKGMLVPFHYYGIYDDVDYSLISFRHGKYLENDLDKLYLGNMKRAELIYDHYHQYKKNRAIGFCSSKKHADYMAKFFTDKGIRATAVYSDCQTDGHLGREDAIQKLNNHELDIIFCVDMFNEGLDIPSISLVLFLRPTQSSTIFLQQLGRGLRKEENKDYLIVLDYIGNYQGVNMIPYLLSSGYPTGTRLITELNYPDECIVDFDFQVINIFEEMRKKHLDLKTKDRIQNEYIRIKELVGHQPSRVELFNNFDEELYQLTLQQDELNLFKDYLGSLKQIGEYNYDFNKDELLFLKAISETKMQKSYKMPVLLSFIQDEGFALEVTQEQLLNAWKKYYDSNEKYLDINKINSYQDYLNFIDKDHLSIILKNPVRFLIESSNGLFIKGENTPIKINSEIRESTAFIEQYKDIIEYRTLHYFKTRYGDKTNN